MTHHDDAELEEIQAIIEIAQEFDLDALAVRDGDWELTLTRRDETLAVAAAPMAAPAQQAPVVAQPAAPLAAAPAPAATSAKAVAAPIIGVFYRAPSPSALVFVNVGDRVEVGQTLCILEAMKLMNEITSEHAGTVTAIAAENGDLVTIGQTLFTIS